MKHVVKFSGGKDSLATLLAVRATQPEYTVVFCDTGWEHPDTYTYLDYIESMIGQPIIRVRNEKYPGGLPDVVVAKGRFPSQKARFCTEELKVKPGIDWVLQQTEDVVIYQGVRADESAARRHLKRNDEYFRFYFQPLRMRGKFDKQIKALSAQLVGAKPGQLDMFTTQDLHAELRALQAKNAATLRPQYDSYRRKEVLAWCEKYSADLVRPVIYWTAEEVISYCLEQGFKLNPLYYRGARRVGCYPCMNSRLSEVGHIAENDPWRIDDIAELENADGVWGTFFDAKKVPDAHDTQCYVNRKGQRLTSANIYGVVAYVQGNPAQAMLLDKASPSGCISHYNICETTI
ncbi:phosphoadenosine phosphosulfate reductase family protein [Hymenobacter sp. B81]|uniref:phosphoadenosine phosphosulfate reductase domain-containing protein n=1 Tax=Hymenobacter sp. B81 TaxID=3344878 RepID=UPI0037DD0985